MATFKVVAPAPVDAVDPDKPEWEQFELSSLPKVLAEQVQRIHEADMALKASKLKFAEQFNASYSEDIPDGMIRIFSFRFDGMSIANTVPKKRKNAKPKLNFTARKSK